MIDVTPPAPPTGPQTEPAAPAPAYMRPMRDMHPQIRALEDDLNRYIAQTATILRFGNFEATCDLMALLARRIGVHIAGLQFTHPDKVVAVTEQTMALIRDQCAASYRVTAEDLQNERGNLGLRS